MAAEGAAAVRRSRASTRQRQRGRAAHRRAGSRRAASSRSCCSPPRRPRASSPSATAQFLVLAVTISMLLAPLTFVAHERLLERWLGAQEAAGVRRHRRRRQPGDHRRLRPLRADRLARAAHGGHSVHRDRDRTTSRSTSCAGSATRSTTATRRGSSCSNRRARATRSSSCSRSTTSRRRSRPRRSCASTFPTCRSSPARAIACIYYRLRDLDIEAIERETFLSSLETARQALEKLGFESARAARAVELFRKHDLAQLDVQYAVRQDEEQLIQTTAQAAAQLQELFESDVKESAELAEAQEGLP